MSELALQLIKENKRTKESFLDLGNCGLKNELPNELLDCVWLERLNLGKYYFDQTQEIWIQSKNNKSINIFIGQELTILQNLPYLQHLELSNNQIQDIGFLQNLPYLQHLELSNNEIRDFSFLQSLTQLQSLYLRDNHIQDISFLQNLSQLKSLNLRNNLIQDISFLQNLSKLKSIVVSMNHIEDISFLQNLSKLEFVDLSFNDISDVSFLQNLSQLQSLYLSINGIQDYSLLQNLTQLKALFISENQIQDISTLQNLTQLQSLDLSNNQIQDISTLQNLSQLQYLNLRNNQIQNISFLQNLSKLESIDLSVNQIQDYSFLQNLSKLQDLDITNNRIQNISFLQNLIQLQSLDLRINEIQDISFLQNLTQLQSLDLRNNQIQDTSFLQSLTQLQHLDLGSNQIQDISFLRNLTKLEHLTLSNNQIQDISFLQNLTKLKYIQLRNNQIQDIEPLVSLFNNGLEAYVEEYGNNGVLLYENAINNPPIEIIKQGREAILRHFERIEQQGYDFIFEAKLTLVGDGGSGKTSLQRRILDEKAELPTGNDRTRGIKVHNWEFKDTNERTYTTHIWDFGGQDVYYPVHRFFLTENSVYVLMASTRFSVHNFDYWIPTIYQFGGSSPIILVQTCDNGNRQDWTDIKPFYGVPEYNLKPVYKINLTSENWGLKNLRGFIQHQITELPHIGKSVPKSWVKVREQLIEKAKTEDYISYEKFSEVCKETNREAFSTDVDIVDLAHFLHDLGIILWYSAKDLLRNLVILKPQWAMEAVYKIIDDALIQEQNGNIYQADFYRIWEDETYRTKISELQVMLQVFKIAFPKQHPKQDYIIPARLQPIPYEKLWSDNENSLRLEYHFDFMPRGIVNQLSAELSNKILSDENIWSNAVILKNDNSHAQLFEELHKRKILIKAKGHDARGLILLIMNSIVNIIKEYRGVVPLIKVPCNCRRCEVLEKPTIFEYEDLIELLNEGRETITCNKSETKLTIFQLLYSVGLEHIKEENQTQKNMENEKKGDTNYNFYAPITGDIGNIGSDSKSIFNKDTYPIPETKKEESKDDKIAEDKAVKKWKMEAIWWFLIALFFTIPIIYTYTNELEIAMAKEEWGKFKISSIDIIGKASLTAIWLYFIYKMLYERFLDSSKEKGYRDLWKSKNK